MQDSDAINLNFRDLHASLSRRLTSAETQLRKKHGKTKIGGAAAPYNLAFHLIKFHFMIKLLFYSANMQSTLFSKTKKAKLSRRA